MNGTDTENVTYAVANGRCKLESSVNSYMGRCPKDSIWIGLGFLKLRTEQQRTKREQPAVNNSSHKLSNNNLHTHNDCQQPWVLLLIKWRLLLQCWRRRERSTNDYYARQRLWPMISQMERRTSAGMLWRDLKWTATKRLTSIPLPRFWNGPYYQTSNSNIKTGGTTNPTNAGASLVGFPRRLTGPRTAISNIIGWTISCRWSTRSLLIIVRMLPLPWGNKVWVSYKSCRILFHVC